ncbi:MAG: MBL fold metallo-hydrolase [Acidobacteriaceae bacterium]|nr:MBL fold metallo-hydrolase [Acidobacteriaceae bacterium]MBV9778950.1 MBL fold metallo-hydrolase [Acidobacteriaceae bacterium]
MDAITLPSYEAVSLDNIAPGLIGVRILFVNVFAIEAREGGWTLIDAGIHFSAEKIKSWAEDHFGKRSRPAAIVLTHGHFDHVGALDALLEDWDVPVYAHLDEFPYLTAQAKYPPPDSSVGGGLMAVLSPLYPRTSVNISGRVSPLPSGGSVPTLSGWQYIHTPGHAPGHISLFRSEDKTLVVGDAFCTTKQESFLAVAKQTPELHGPPAYYTPDRDSARRSVEKLAALRPTTIAPGHGLPMSGNEVPDQLQRLAAEFDRIALPEHGRYVKKTATYE